MPLLHQIRLENLLSFGPSMPALELRPLNVFIGPNGSGKSNLIEAISFLKSAAKHLGDEVRDAGGIHDWLWKGAKYPTATVEIVAENPDPSRKKLRHAISFREITHRMELVDEFIEDCDPMPGHQLPYFYYKHQNGRPVINVRGGQKRELQREEIDPERSILSQRQDPDQYPEITYLRDRYDRIQIYREWSFGRYTPPRQPQKADGRTEYLEPDCSNLGMVLNRMRRDPTTKEMLIERLNELYPNIKDVDVIIEGGTVQVFLTEGKFAIPATRLSDGTLRYLCLLAILGQPNPPPLICIEEPELGLHPDVLSFLGPLLKEAATRTQLIVTTHSDELIDSLSDTPEDVVVCEKHDGQTEMRRLDRGRLEVWLEEYSLGTLWRRGDLGGNRW